MADKKDEAPQVDPVNEMVFVLGGLFLLSILIARVQYLWNQGRIAGATTLWGWVSSITLALWPFLRATIIFAGALAFVGIIYHYHKLSQLNKEEGDIYKPTDSTTPLSAEAPMVKNDRWERVLILISSSNESDWRLAIIEADVMLDELLRASGYQGDSVGEMLKGVEKSDFLTLEAAWEAHKIRNRVAHSGSDFRLNEREVKQAISLYEEVFKEFKMI